MQPFITYVLRLLAYNCGVAFLMFAIIVYARRKEREVTSLRGLAIFLIGWLVGSLLVFVVHLLFSLGGTEVRGGPLDSPVSFVIILSVMYATFGWLSEARVAGPPK